MTVDSRAAADEVAHEPVSPQDARPARALAWLSDAPAALAGLALVAVFVAWGQLGGGFDPTRWMPGALLVAGLVAAILVGSRGGLRLGRREQIALASLAGFAVWSFVSILWAGVPGDAWIGADRTLLYLGVFTTFLLLPWTARAAQVVAWTFAAGVTLVAAHAVLVVATTNDDTLFVDGRMSYPTGYANANVALFMAAFWIALVVATRREQPVLVRGLAMGSAVFLSQAALVVQSRAAMVAVPLVAALVVASTPGRLRTGFGLAAVAVPVVAGWRTHLEVYEQAEAEGARFLEDTMQPSARLMAVTAAVGVLVGLAWAVADRRYTLSQRATRALGTSALAAVFVVLLTGTVLVARSGPVERVRVAWSELTTNETEYEGALRLGSLDSERWDHWRVGVGRFLDRPLVGIGAEQFNVDYLRERTTSVDARYVHSFGIGVFSQLGLVGALLFGTFAVLATLLAHPRADDDPVAGTVRLGAFALWIYWLVHGSVDWFYEIPAVTAPVFAFLGLAAALGPRAAPAAPDRWRGVATLLGVVACAAALLSLAPPYLAARDVKAATEVWDTDSEAAFDRLERARALNPLSDEPDLYAAAIATRLDDRVRMRLYFTRTLERNPFNWYAHLQLGLTYGLEGRRQAALREVRRAQELNPADEIVEDVVERLERGERVTPRSVDRLFVERVLGRLR